MQELDTILQNSVVLACDACFQAQMDAAAIQVQQTRKEFDGDRTIVVFGMTKFSKLSPEATGEAVGKWMVDHEPLVLAYQVVKGFLNLTIVPEFWTEALLKATTQTKFGFASPHSKPQVMVEYSSPNTNKPLHLGHLRNNFLGFSVSKILEAYGHEVIKVQIINDRGIHICKSMVAWDAFGNGETPESTGLKGDKLVGKYYVAFDQHFKKEVAQLLESGVPEEQAKKSAPILLKAQDWLNRWEQGDEEIVSLWSTMNQWVYAGFEKTYTEMGVHFDQLYYESNTYLLGRDEVMKGLTSGAFYQKDDGSIWVDLTDEGLDEKLLLRRDGTAVYMTQDIGTALLRYEQFPGLSQQIYTVGNEQEYHFKVLFKILKKLGIRGAENNFHLSYGMVELPQGKMKSREGTVVDADELLLEMAQTARSMADELGKIQDLSEDEKTDLFKTIGYGALKYFLLKVSPSKSMMFDPQASIDFIGNTGPFIQFNYVRARSVLRKCIEEQQMQRPQSIDPKAWDDTELRLIQLGLMWPQVIEQAALACDPSLVANHCYELTKSYSRWYQDHSVLQESEPSKREARMMLCEFFTNQIHDGMGLLGIQMPERM